MERGKGREVRGGQGDGGRPVAPRWPGEVMMVVGGWWAERKGNNQMWGSLEGLVVGFHN